MEYKYFEKYKDLPLKQIRRKCVSLVEEEREWYEEWKSVRAMIWDIMNRLNREDKGWASGLDFEKVTTRELMDYVRERLENLGYETVEERVTVLLEERARLKR